MMICGVHTKGEKVIKKVYEAVRSSPAWNDTLLIITYDEHGGFMDHVPTPVRDVPVTDGINWYIPYRCMVCHVHITHLFLYDDSTAPQFDFKRLGVRIPTIAISPWVCDILSLLSYLYSYSYPNG